MTACRVWPTRGSLVPVRVSTGAWRRAPLVVAVVVGEVLHSGAHSLHCTNDEVVRGIARMMKGVVCIRDDFGGCRTPTMLSTSPSEPCGICRALPFRFGVLAMLSHPIIPLASMSGHHGEEPGKPQVRLLVRTFLVGGAILPTGGLFRRSSACRSEIMGLSEIVTFPIEDHDPIGDHETLWPVPVLCLDVTKRDMLRKGRRSCKHPVGGMAECGSVETSLLVIAPRFRLAQFVPRAVFDRPAPSR